MIIKLQQGQYMKFKHLIVFLSLLLLLLNTLAGVILDVYSMPSCLMVDLSMFITASMLYFLSAGFISDGYKISISIILLFTGFIRLVCMGNIGTDFHNNLILLIALTVLIVEIALLFVVSYLSRK